MLIFYNSSHIYYITTDRLCYYFNIDGRKSISDAKILLLETNTDADSCTQNIVNVLKIGSDTHILDSQGWLHRHNYSTKSPTLVKSILCDYFVSNNIRIKKIYRDNKIISDTGDLYIYNKLEWVKINMDNDNVIQCYDNISETLVLTKNIESNTHCLWKIISGTTNTILLKTFPNTLNIKIKSFWSCSSQLSCVFYRRYKIAIIVDMSDVFVYDNESGVVSQKYNDADIIIDNKLVRSGEILFDAKKIKIVANTIQYYYDDYNLVLNVFNLDYYNTKIIYTCAYKFNQAIIKILHFGIYGHDPYYFIVLEDSIYARLSTCKNIFTSYNTGNFSNTNYNHKIYYDELCLIYPTLSNSFVGTSTSVSTSEYDINILCKVIFPAEISKNISRYSKTKSSRNTALNY
jgi:hypothetical protein